MYSYLDFCTFWCPVWLSALEKAEVVPGLEPHRGNEAPDLGSTQEGVCVSNEQKRIGGGQSTHALVYGFVSSALLPCGGLSTFRNHLPCQG